MLIFIITYDYADYVDNYQNKFHSVYVTLEKLREELNRLASCHNVEKDFSSLEIKEPGRIECFTSPQDSKFDNIFMYYVEVHDAE
jgi:hypothetical protein